MRIITKTVIFLLAFSAVTLQADLSDGLQLHYTFDSMAGSKVYDESGNSYTGTIVGTAATAAGVQGNGFSFDGSTYIDVGNVLGLTGTTTQLTVSLWFSIPPSAAPNTCLISKWIDAYPGTGWFIENLSDASRIASGVIANYPSEMALAYTDDADELNDGVWRHLCTTFDVTPTSIVTRIYVNGSAAGVYLGEATDIGAHGPVDNPAIPLLVGARYEPINGPIWQFDGLLDEVRIYNRIINGQEILDLYANPPPSPPPGPGDDAPYISLLGFSNDPEGDQDVTEFYSDETLYISLQDVDLDENDPKTEVTALLIQRGPTLGSRRLEKRIRLERQESGAYTGSIPLNALYKGEALVIVKASSPQSLIFSRHSIIRIMSAVEKDGFLDSGGRPTVNPSSK